MVEMRMIRGLHQVERCHGGHRDGTAIGHGRPVGGDRTAAAQAPQASARRSSAAGRPGDAERDFVCAQDRHSVGVPAAGNGLRVGHDLLAPTARLAEGRRVGSTAPRASRPSACGGQDRFLAGRGGQRLGSGRGRGKKRGQTPQTAANRARSTTSSRMRKAFRWPFDSPEPSGTT